MSRGEIANSAHARRFELGARLRANAIDPARRQRPHAHREIVHGQNGQPVWFVEIRSNFGEELVGRDADRTGQTRCSTHRVFDGLRDFARAFPCIVWRLFCSGGCLGRNEIRQIEVHLVDAVIFDVRHNGTNRYLEKTRVTPIRFEISGQPHRVRSQLCRFHQAHSRVQSECSRLVCRGGDDTAPHIVAQPGKALHARLRHC